MNEQEKNAGIAYILDHGLVVPQRLRAKIAEMFRNLGLRFIFWDTGYSLFFAALTVTIVSGVFIIVPQEYKNSAAVAVAPLLFLLMTLFAETSERAGGLFELKQTCRYTVRQVMALRVLCYALVGVAFTAIIAAASVHSGYEFLSLFPLCLAALFVCAVFELSALRLSGKWAAAIFSAAWVFVNATIPFTFRERWEKLLADVPIAISLTICMVGLTVLALQIKNMLSEVKKYAVA
jgi:hypothetical protein